MYQGKIPEAFYRIENLEDQKFVGKCLANVSERLSAKELLLDPFLATEQLDSPLPSPTLPKKQTPTLNFTALLAKELPPPKSNQTKDTHMTITGSMNEENDTVFLKVQISNKNGSKSLISSSLTISIATSMAVSFMVSNGKNMFLFCPACKTKL